MRNSHSTEPKREGRNQPTEATASTGPLPPDHHPEHHPNNHHHYTTLTTRRSPAEQAEPRQEGLSAVGVLKKSSRKS